MEKNEETKLTKAWLISLGFQLFPWGFVNNGVLIIGDDGNFHVKLGNGKRISLQTVEKLKLFMSLIDQE